MKPIDADKSNVWIGYVTLKHQVEDSNDGWKKTSLRIARTKHKPVTQVRTCERNPEKLGTYIKRLSFKWPTDI